jgi:hypothetical protein
MNNQKPIIEVLPGDSLIRYRDALRRTFFMGEGWADGMV